MARQHAVEHPELALRLHHFNAMSESIGGKLMLNKWLLTGALAVSAGALAAAQQPQTRPTTETSAAKPQKSPTTVIGCVYREKDVPGRAPNVAERAGVLEDYILAEVSGLSGSTGATGTSGSTAKQGAAAGAGATGPMYKLEFAKDDQLKTLVGKRVEAVGIIDAEAGDSAAPAPGTKSSTTDKALGRDRVDLAEFEVSSIKEVAGTCPATPASRP
jgi:hypothetical protein